ncbi:MAG: hypothetical protein MUF01_02920 [Bryobacterales bacterium]|jgi:hypothetical protein|nr:hypothetical protein [Bryobacterales bacterium]
MDPGQLEAAAQRLRASCLAEPGQPDAAALSLLVKACASHDEDVATSATKLLIGAVVEDLSDRFQPPLVDCYVSLFTQVLAACQPVWSADFLRNRYQQLRAASPPLSALAIEQVFVLSRITLGADIAITSVFLDAIRKRYAQARLWLVGPAKNHELFAGDPTITHWPLDYPRGGSLRQRIAVSEQLSGLCDQPGTLIVDPDSRITQLGLLPIAPSTRTLFFESRTADPDSPRTLSEIASGFCFLRLAVPDAAPFLALSPHLDQTARVHRAQCPHAPITVSLGVGGNVAKRVGDGFESALLRQLASTGRPLWLDAGAGGAEAAWVRAAAASLPSARVRILDGSFASFCAHIAHSALYVGYDSAGQHAASALGVPGVTFFRGAVNERMLARWTPRGPHSHVIPVASGSPDSTLLDSLGAHLNSYVRNAG